MSNSRLLRYVLSAIVLALAIVKIVDWGSGRLDKALFPGWVLLACSVLEVAGAAALLSRLWPLAAIGLMTVFTVFLTFAAVLIAVGGDIENCGCMGARRVPAALHLVITIVLAALCWRLSASVETSSNGGRGVRGPAGA